MEKSNEILYFTIKIPITLDKYNVNLQIGPWEPISSKTIGKIQSKVDFNRLQADFIGNIQSKVDFNRLQADFIGNIQWST
ncbi:hypothetical protein [Paenibacillus marchantiophytorum]|uniref:hypothetical protein n=1 Tax=Paenibacillus marchantiophytorum TaxID=1619310 RepID=UPI001665339F|nr:hypothetical protein [Paenibacillus marchantiophytorum]